MTVGRASEIDKQLWICQALWQQYCGAACEISKSYKHFYIPNRVFHFTRYVTADSPIASWYRPHYSDVIMGAMAFKITTVSIVYNRLFRRRSKKTSKLRVTGPCEGNSPVTGEFPTQRASNAKNASIWWRHHAHWNNKIVRKRMRFFEDKLCLKMCLSLQLLVTSNHFFFIHYGNNLLIGEFCMHKQ